MLIFILLGCLKTMNPALLLVNYLVQLSNGNLKLLEMATASGMKIEIISYSQMRILLISRQLACQILLKEIPKSLA